MSFIEVSVTKIVDRAFPGFVAFQFVDVNGDAHVFHDKLPVLGIEESDLTDGLPIALKLECAVLEVTARGTLIDTSKPHQIEDVTGNTQFLMPSSSISDIGEASEQS